MENNELKKAVDAIQLPVDMEERILRNCKAAACRKTRPRFHFRALATGFACLLLVVLGIRLFRGGMLQMPDYNSGLIAVATEESQTTAHAALPTEDSTQEPSSEQTTEVGTKPTEQQATEPKSTAPQPTEPNPTEPQTTEPQPTEPKPTEPQPTEPKPTEPKPTEPKPTEPKPTEPKPTEPKPPEPTTAPEDHNQPELLPEYAIVDYDMAKSYFGYSILQCSDLNFSYYQMGRYNDSEQVRFIDMSYVFSWGRITLTDQSRGGFVAYGTQTHTAQEYGGNTFWVSNANSGSVVLPQTGSNLIYTAQFDNTVTASEVFALMLQLRVK